MIPILFGRLAMCCGTGGDEGHNFGPSVTDSLLDCEGTHVGVVVDYESSADSRCAGFDRLLELLERM